MGTCEFESLRRMSREGDISGKGQGRAGEVRASVSTEAPKDF